MTVVTGSSQWYGSFFEGTGNLSTETTDTIRGVAYTYASRFEGAPGTDNQGSDGHGYSVEGIHLIVQADRPDITDEKFQQIADDARKLCTISKILRVPITLDASRVTLPATN